MHREEADALAPYAVDLTRESIDVFTERYGFELKEPVVIEMYPDHEDFAVRTAGMPGIPILGATFGYVVAMDSPAARPPREFQWGTTLWHEMAHVFTLEATAHLVPRWFSEGVSVFEEWRSGPTPGVRVPMSVLNAMKEDRFLPVATLDEGFIRPTYEEQVIVSYMQAGLICLFIDELFGSQRLKALLDAFGEGLQTGDAIARVFDRSPETFDDEFGEFIEARYGDLLDNLDHWHRTRELMLGRLGDEEWSAVIEPAEHMIELYPNYVEPDSPYVALARAFDELDRRDDAIAALERFWQSGGYDPSVLMRLAGWLVDESRTDSAIDVLETVTMVDPFDRDLHGKLGDLLMDAGRAEDASREYAILIALDPHDKANAYYRMARANHALGDREASQSSLMQALEIAPNYRPAQRLLLELMRADVSDEQH